MAASSPAPIVRAPRIGIELLDPVDRSFFNQPLQCPVDLRRRAQTVLAKERKKLVGPHRLSCACERFQHEPLVAPRPSPFFDVTGNLDHVMILHNR